MRVVIDVEANGLEHPTKIWVIVCKDIDTGQLHIFREPTTYQRVRDEFYAFAQNVDLWVGHNLLGYDFIHLDRLLGTSLYSRPDIVLDTLIISKMVDYPRDGHSIEDYGLEFNYPKIKFNDFSKYSLEMEEYCIRDVNISQKIFHKYSKYINDPKRQAAIRMEHEFQKITNTLHDNGFAFNTKKAEQLLEQVTAELSVIDVEIAKEFPPRLKLIKEVTPRATKFGTISKTSIPRAMHDQIQYMDVDAPFMYCSWEEFNPSSHKQLIQVLSEAGWSPIDKTKTHLETEREYNKLKYARGGGPELDLRKSELYNKLLQLEKYGWKINENNLSTLPSTAPSPARALAKRILLEARRRTLTEWLGLVHPDTGRIHGKFYGIGAWTHRMAHQNPNTANIPNEFDTFGNKKPYGKEMRSLWQAPKNRLLVGVDAEGIQLRIFAHYIDDQEFTDALVNGKKEDKSDPHSLNQRILGDVCKTRQAAKRFIFALLLGAGLSKLGEILGCGQSETEAALARLLERYQGFAYLKENVIPADARRGWFEGLDGRAVKILGDTMGQRKHLAMSGYLQNGEAVVMKLATLHAWREIPKRSNWPEHWHKYLDRTKLVNFVHDEWQTEVPNDVDFALEIAKLQADSLRIVGEQLKLKCPLSGSYWNDDLKKYTIATNWSYTH